MYLYLENKDSRLVANDKKKSREKVEFEICNVEKLF